MRQDSPQTSTLGLMAGTLRQFSSLFSKEVELAKAEMSEGVNRTVMAVAMMLAAAVMAMIALNLLAGALVALLVAGGISAGWATLIVAAGFGVTTIVLIGVAIKILKATSVVPHRAARNLRRDVSALTETALS